jgi:subtilase family serine protease
MIVVAWTRFTESPLIGLGLGSKFEIVLLEYDLGVNYYIDNLWVVTLCKFGLIGFIPFSIYVYRSIIANSIKASFSRRNLHHHEIYNIYIIMLTGELMMSLTTAMLWVHVASIIPFSILTGILLTHQRRGNENHR